MSSCCFQWTGQHLNLPDSFHRFSIIFLLESMALKQYFFPRLIRSMMFINQPYHAAQGSNTPLYSVLYFFGDLSYEKLVVEQLVYP